MTGWRSISTLKMTAVKRGQNTPKVKAHTISPTGTPNTGRPQLPARLYFKRYSGSNQKVNAKDAKPDNRELKHTCRGERPVVPPKQPQGDPNQSAGDEQARHRIHAHPDRDQIGEIAAGPSEDVASQHRGPVEPHLQPLSPHHRHQIPGQHADGITDENILDADTSGHPAGVESSSCPRKKSRIPRSAHSSVP